MSEHLIDHHYTVSEIGRMRSAIGEIISLWEWLSPNVARRALRDDEKHERVELELRTYMIAGRQLLSRALA